MPGGQRDRNEVQEPDTTVLDVEDHCVLSLDEHMELTLSAMTTFGIAVACPEQYKALLVIAEAARQLHGHPAFDPTEIAARMVWEAREHAKRQAERREVKRHREVFPAPDNGIMH